MSLIVGAMKKILLAAMSVFVLLSCGVGEQAEEAVYSIGGSGKSVAEDGVALSVEAQPDLVEKKIIRDGSIRVDVQDLVSSKEWVDSLVAKYEAYYSEESYNDYSSSVLCILTVRIPCVSFDSFIADIESGDGEVVSKSLYTRDVTEQYYDLETRLANKRSYLACYRELLARASTVKDIVEIETQIRVIEEEIESAEGRLRLMKDQIAYSTLTITMETAKTIGHADGFGQRVRDALAAGWDGLVSLFVSLFYIWPLWVVSGIGGIYVAWRVRKRRMGRKNVK